MRPPMRTRSRRVSLALGGSVATALAALACASMPPAGPSSDDQGTKHQGAKKERNLITGSHIPREGSIPEHGVADAPFRAEVITRDDIRRSGAMTAAEALQRN